MRKTYVVSAKRSAIGSFLGSLTTVKPVDLGATVVKAVSYTHLDVYKRQHMHALL